MPDITLNKLKEKEAQSESIRNTIDSGKSAINSYSDPDFVNNQVNDKLSGLIQNPISSVLNKTISKINNLVSVVENKINRLAEDLVKSVDKKGRVELVGNTIVITVKQQDVDKVNEEKVKLDNKIRNINENLNNLKNILSTLSKIQKIIDTIKKILDIQEIALSANPVFAVFKKAIKILFLKDMLKEYSNVLKSELKSSQEKFNSIIERFRHLRISIKVQDDDIKSVTNEKAEDQILSELLSNGESESVDYVSDEFTTSEGIIIVAKVEKYGNREIIARAYDKFSGMIVAQTAPSFVSSPENLISELKDIIELQ